MSSILVKSKDSYLRVIGLITVNMSNLEDTMAECIDILIGDDKEANKRITAGEPFANLLRLLDVLFRYRVLNETKLLKFTSITKTLNRINDERNINVHGVLKFFRVSPDKFILHKHKYSKMNIGKFRNDDTPPSLSTLKKLAKEIDREAKILLMFILDNFLTIKLHQAEVIKNESTKNQTLHKFLGKYLEKPKETSTETKS